MDSAAGAMWVAAAGLAVAAVAVARAGWRHASYRGWRWWVAALGVGSAGIALAPLHGEGAWVPAATGALLLAWPLLALIGLRRFHSRLGLPGHERIDWAVLAAGATATLLATALPTDPVSALLVPVTAMLLVHVYAGAVAAGSRTAEDDVALRMLAATFVAVALPPSLVWAVGGGPGEWGPGTWRALGAAFGLIVLSYVTLGLMSERTERELRNSRRRLRVLANTDPLTGVPNRRHFSELADRSLRGAGDDTPVLLLFDVDHFKLINDQLGHAAGDRALRLVGRCMQDALRARDLAGRLGGDEFALLLAGASLQQALGVADRIVNTLQLRSTEHRLPSVGLSFGLVQVHAGETLDESLRRADQALYEAKRLGRSCAVAAQGDEDEPVFSESKRLGLTPL